MPQSSDSDGIAILQKLKGCKPPPTLAVLTYYPYSLHRALCLQAGADFVFDKSAGLEELKGLFAGLR